LIISRTAACLLVDKRLLFGIDGENSLFVKRILVCSEVFRMIESKINHCQKWLSEAKLKARSETSHQKSKFEIF